jgi:cysteine desulfurase
MIYLDNAATTPVDGRVLEEMNRCYNEYFGNPSSIHSIGVEAKNLLHRCRATIAHSIGAGAGELIFTGSGTESNNLALKGIAFANRAKGNHIIVSGIEHDCVLNTCKWLQGEGFDVSYVPVNENGIVDLTVLEKMINPKTILVSVMFANNEIGTIQPVSEIGEICRERGVYFHSDACQAYGKIPIHVREMNIDLLTLNAHKVYGPKGVGALYVRNGIRIDPILHGGGQEGGFRSSTENLPGIAGFAKAAELAMKDIHREYDRLINLKLEFIDWLTSQFENAYINGSVDHALPSLVNFSFSGLEGDTIRLLLLLDELGIALSTGSACSSNHKQDASHVLRAIGLNQLQARGAIRVSLGRFTTEAHMKTFTDALKENVNKLNSIYS